MPVSFGIDGNAQLKALLVDASGRTIVSASELTTTGGKLLVDSSGRLIISGERADGTDQPFLLDNSGRVVINASEITTTGGKILVDSLGRLSVVSSELVGVAPYARVLNYDNFSLAAGTQTLTIGTVTAGELWEINQLQIRYDGTVAGVTANIRSTINTLTYVHLFVNVFVTGVWQIFNVNFVSDGGTLWETIVTGATLNDDIRVRVYGRKVQ